MSLTPEKRIQLLQEAEKRMKWLQKKWARLLRVKAKLQTTKRPI